MVLLPGFVYIADCALKAENCMRNYGTSFQILIIRAMTMRMSRLKNHILQKKFK